MTIAILGAGNPIPTFIERRLNLLKSEGIKLIIIQAYGQRVVCPNALIIRQGGWSKMNFGDVLQYLINLFIYIPSFLKLLKVNKTLHWIIRIKWALKMIPFTQFPKPDIIHLQWISMANDYAWLKQFYSCPIVASARGSQLTVYPQTIKGYAEKIRMAIERADYIHCVSKSIVSVCKQWGAADEEIFLNYNGVNCDYFSPPENENISDVFRIISVGSLIWRKGYIYQLLIVKKLINAGKKIELTIIGDGEDHKAIIYTILLLGLKDNVLMTGSLKSAEILDKLRKSNIYLSTSAAEGLSNSVLEAASCGLPVFAFSCEGMEEAILKDKSGCIVPFGDIDSMVSIIENTMHEGRILQAMGIEARKHMLDQFNARKWSIEMINWYKKIRK